MSGKSLVLSLDRNGYPVKWVTIEQAVSYYATGSVLWELGGEIAKYRGGVSRLTGAQSIIESKSIIALDGEAVLRGHDETPKLTSRSLFTRDRKLCAYCGKLFAEDKLSKDHIQPISRGGKDTWMNVVTACRPCNGRKDNKRPEEAGMQLVYAPYTPNRCEGLILRNRRILADQMEFLMAKVPKKSRLWLPAH